MYRKSGHTSDTLGLPLFPFSPPQTSRQGFPLPVSDQKSLGLSQPGGAPHLTMWGDGVGKSLLSVSLAQGWVLKW
jgi:hypothetical protein